MKILKWLKESKFKKTVLCVALLLSISFLLCGCIDGIMNIIRDNILIIPDNETIGEAKTFEKDEFSIVLTDKFVEIEEGKEGFHTYFASEFCAVFFFKEEFTVQQGFAKMSLEEYCQNVADGITEADITPQYTDGRWFCEMRADGNYSKMYFYKGNDAFWIVQFICDEANEDALKDTFYLWSEGVEIK